MNVVLILQSPHALPSQLRGHRRAYQSHVFDRSKVHASVHNKDLLNRALDALPVEFREVLVLRELEDLSYKEISRIAEIPMGTVMSRLTRACRSLWEWLVRNDKEQRGGVKGNQETAARTRG
jgi:DNA-directed RNA polymerase specialized sigma24 family protein